MIALVQETLQQADVGFFAPTAVAYLGACGLWMAARWLRPGDWATGGFAVRRSWIDLLVAVAVIAGILGLGELWRRDWLLPRSGGLWVYNLNQLIIWSPLFLALVVRRQPLQTVYLQCHRLGAKCVTGLVIALLTVTIFLGMRGEWSRFGDVLIGCASSRSIGHFVPVFLEGVGIAFLIERLRWVVGAPVSVLIASILFAAAHVPGSLEDGRGAGYIAAFFVFNTGLCAAIAATVMRSRDVVWIGIVHYVMDVAIEAF